MRNNNELTIYGLNENIAYCEAMGLAKCFEAYADILGDILDGGIGFNPNSGYVYITLEEGVTICSMLGGAVGYMVTDFDSGEEFFFDTYQEAENHLLTITDYNYHK